MKSYKSQADLKHGGKSMIYSNIDPERHLSYAFDIVKQFKDYENVLIVKKTFYECLVRPSSIHY